MFSKTYKLQNINNEIYDTHIGSLPPAGSWPQPGWFGKNARIAFIGQNPGLPKIDEPFEHERNQDTYLRHVAQSPTGKVIHRIIEEAGLTWDDVVYTNLVKCPTPENRKPFDFEVEYYKRYLKQQFECLSISLIIIFGKPAAEGLLGDVSVPNKFMGISTDWNQQSCDIFAAYHPSYVLRIGKVVEYTNEISNFIKENNVALLLRDQSSGYLQDSSS